jgi:hypothetical protein
MALARKLHRKVAVTAVALLGALAAVSSGSAAGPPFPLRDATLVTGPPEAFHPGAGIADLDHGLVAGSTRYVHDDGLVWTETFAPFLWSEHGSPTLFALPDYLSRVSSFYIPSGMTPNGSEVVGSVIFRRLLFTEPWAWTPTRGLEFLQLPEDENYGGGAVGVSNDGRLIAGTLAGRFVPSLAAVWRDRKLEVLPSSQPWSEVHAISGDGSTVVGASGPSFDSLQATRWVLGREQRLSTGDFDAQSSVALFVADNRVVFGTATSSDGRTVLLRWDALGRVQVLTPPDNLDVARFSSIDSVGGAAGGALAQRTDCISAPDPACDWAPFVWTQQGGFTILPENGLEQTYDRSTVNDVSDGGRVAVGELAISVRSDTSPRQVGFAWSAASGLVLVNDLVARIGQSDPDYWTADRVSGNGGRVLVTGNPPVAVHDTQSIILDLTPVWAGTAPASP